MSIVAIASEYNPFHFGHAYQIEQIRKHFGEDSTVIAIMSGDFVQRGERAAFSKLARAEAACLSGADMVIELPLPWSLASAEGFARGCVGLMNMLKVDIISFGSESGDINELQRAAELISTEEFNDKVKRYMSERSNISYPTARQAVLHSMAGETANVLSSPNNLLGVEYLKEIIRQKVDITQTTVKRFGNGHDKTGDGFKSSSELRARLAVGESVKGLIPESALNIYSRETECGRVCDSARYEAAILSRLRMLKKDDFAAAPDAADGVGERLYSAVRSQTSIADIVAAAATKRYTVSRLRRILLCSALGVTAGMAGGIPPYARLLAADERGCAHLKMLRASGTPILTKPADVSGISTRAADVFTLGSDAHDLYTLTYINLKQGICGTDWKTSPFIVKSV